MNIIEQILSKETPAYFYKLNSIRENYKEYKNRLPSFSVYYSLKANSEKPVLRALQGVADGVEVANKDEFILAQNAGFSGGEIICSAPIKSVDSIVYMYNHGCRYFVYDNLIEYQKLNCYAPDSKKIMRIYITDLDKNNIEFGLNYKEVSNIIPDGITIHMSSHSNQLLHNVFDRLDKTIDLLINNTLIKSKLIINLGGSYLLNHPIEYYESINNKQNTIIQKYQKIDFEWIIEPGGGIVDAAVLFSCRVENIKRINNLNYIYIDGGIPEGINIKHGKMTNLTNNQKTKWRNIYIFFDSTCLHKQLFIYADKSVINYQDILLFDHCGAYTTCYINRFHAKQPPAMHILDEE